MFFDLFCAFSVFSGFLLKPRNIEFAESVEAIIRAILCLLFSCDGVEFAIGRFSIV
jgi:hypothetical protein